eukprot:CAMPEP_0172444164 /NCGR_PEP_ID=MMETSP1065-20121228/4245_1 /TAXON_ID=265537 /ORGANISM="Amphiprora paludosa, Strain CCMP125" /LENGTH=151 /DNA_ID=CAMNT_0013194589 /DNA_START=21 /DNA_END=476 /DNA_ORIENTATION=-
MNQSTSVQESSSSPSRRRLLLSILLVLVALTCYTTFWLPYPHIRPATPGAVLSRLGAPPGGMVSTSKAHSAAATSSLHHARAPLDVEWTFHAPTTLDPNDPLTRYYQQEGFSTVAWTKYVNMGALGLVVAWLVYEARRSSLEPRKEDRNVV